MELTRNMNDVKETAIWDVVVVGTGFAGMFMIYKLTQLGLKVLALEEATGVGGTWYWNRYPGARCDVESMEYSFSFSHELEQEWEWKDRYSTQSDILKYADHVADRFNLRRYIRFNSRVESANYDETHRIWILTTTSGDVYRGKYCVMATGTLSSINVPKFEGLDSYQGEWYTTGRWPHTKVDFKGKRVAIIGTGSSAIQSIPVIAKEAQHLTVFQRTPNYSVPAHNRPLETNEIDTVKRNYSSIREKARESQSGISYLKIGTQNAFDVSENERDKQYQNRWEYGGTGITTAYMDIGTDENANNTAAEFVRRKIRGIVSDPVVAELLSPKNTIGCKRICVDTNYYETYNRENVSLIDVNETPIIRLVPHGLQTTDKTFSFDCIIFAIGFDAMTGALLAIDIRGKSGISLREKWENGPMTYLGLSTEGFPNMFTITGPGSPSVLSNMITSIEQHVNWIADCITYIGSLGKEEIEATKEAEIDWTNQVEEIAQGTLRYTCNSWYVGANVPGKKRIFMPYAGGLSKYNEECKKVASAGYTGFSIV